MNHKNTNIAFKNFVIRCKVATKAHGKCCNRRREIPIGPPRLGQLSDSLSPTNFWHVMTQYALPQTVCVPQPHSYVEA